MQFKKPFLIAAATILLCTVSAWAKPQVNITIEAKKEVVVTEDGKQVKTLIEAKDIFPGETILYALIYNNAGDEAATNLVVSDPIPEGTAYVAGSASEAGDLSFSIDGGATYKKPTLLTYEIAQKDGTKVTHVASPEEYTHIRWILPKVTAGESGTINFKVFVK